MLRPQQRELLRHISMSTGQLAVQTLSGIERGSVVTLSMVLDALLLSEADVAVFLHVRERFVDLPTAKDLTVLYNALLGVCDLAVCFDEARAHEIGISLLSLSAQSNSSLN